MLLKEGDVLGLLLCAVSVLQERIRRKRLSLTKGMGAADTATFPIAKATVK